MGIVKHPVPATTTELFKVVTRRPQKVRGLGHVDAGVDVTEQLGNFRHLQALVEQGEVIVVPITDYKDIPVATKAVEPVEETAIPTGETVSATEVNEATEEVEAPQAEPDVQEDDGDGNDDAEADYMEDPTGFTVKEVVAYAEAHPEHVGMLLEMEAEGKNRSGIVTVLTAMLGTE